MEKLKKYLDANGIPWRPVEEWSLIFGNHPEGIYIPMDVAPINYIRKLGLFYEYRGHFTSVYVCPAQ